MICYPQPPGCSRHFDGIGGLQIPRLNRSNLFLRRIANPSGRLTEDNPYCISKIPILLEKAGWGFFNLILLFKANV